MKKLTTLPLLAVTSLLTAQTPNFDYLNINQVNAKIHSAGMMFSDTVNGGNGYEFPNGSGLSTYYNSGLWIGATDFNGQLYLAGQSEYSGKDYYPGPISDSIWYNDAHQLWNNVWKVDKADIDLFVGMIPCLLDPSCTLPPGYTIPSSIMSWPAHGNMAHGQEFQIAPFVDINNDGIYDPLAGDHPCIKGDQAIFTIFNDDYTHEETGGQPLRVEIMALHYAYSSSDSALNNTIFSEYKITNKSINSYSDLHIGFYEDMDVGNAADDFVGCDIERNLGYSYNGTATDSPSSNSYNGYVPAQGILLLKGPQMDNDNYDNMVGIASDQSINGCNFGDLIDDNERLGMTSFGYFSTTLPNNIYGAPTTAAEYYSKLRGYWKDGTQYRYGGNGHFSDPNNTGIKTAFCFPDDSDTNYYLSSNGAQVPNWSETTESLTPGERGLLLSTGGISLSYGESVDLAIARISAADYDGNNLSSLDLLKSYSDDIRNFYPCDSESFICSAPPVGLEEQANITLEIYPNPGTGIFNYTSDATNINSVRIVDLTGKVVRHLNTVNANGTIDISDVNNGIYFLSFQLDNGMVVSKRIIKND